MRVLVINDLSCVGKCSLSVALPIISACGVTCDVLPTAILSTHTGGFEGYTFRDLTDDLPEILKHWKTLGIKFDFIYSGYLGSIRQIELVSILKQEFLAEDGKFIVDPVMGDDGKLYQGFTEGYVEKMRGLCKEADYILPNVTEACLLAEHPYPVTKENAREVLNKLAEICPFPIVTGITVENDVAVYYTKRGRGIFSFTHENVQGFFCGAGDVFASAFVGCLANGIHEAKAIYLASEFTAKTIRRSAREVDDKRYGLSFEKEILGFLDSLLFS
ncbi:MAG: pyridoxamine kinase [Clostridia bacterium]|nr:pyridoxamine kinase [Clostridia bacterium]